MLKKRVLLVSLLVLCSCIETPLSEYVEAGVIIPERKEGEEAWLAPTLISGIRVKRNQAENIRTEVFFGYRFDFIENFKKNLYGDFDSDSRFYFQRTIDSEKYGIDLSTNLLEFIDLSDFENTTKYSFYFERPNGENGAGLIYQFSFCDNLTLNDFIFDKGSISYELCVVSNNNDISYPDRCTQYYYKVYYLKSNNSIVFSDDYFSFF